MEKETKKTNDTSQGIITSFKKKKRKPDPKNKQIELPRLPHSANRLVESVYPPPPP